MTPFQQSVYDMISTIPHGKVTSYLLLARALGCKSPRAVGQALRVNPNPVTVPCHRVISHTLGLGGYHGNIAGPLFDRKIKLLKEEGVPLIQTAKGWRVALTYDDLWEF